MEWPTHLLLEGGGGVSHVASERTSHLTPSSPNQFGREKERKRGKERERKGV